MANDRWTSNYLLPHHLKRQIDTQVGKQIGKSRQIENRQVDIYLSSLSSSKEMDIERQTDGQTDRSIDRQIQRRDRQPSIYLLSHHLQRQTATEIDAQMARQSNIQKDEIWVRDIYLLFHHLKRQIDRQREIQKQRASKMARYTKRDIEIERQQDIQREIEQYSDRETEGQNRGRVRLSDE